MVDHPVADLVRRSSAWLDEHPELLAGIAADLAGEDGPADAGRRGLSCETVLRCAVLKQLRGETFVGGTVPCVHLVGSGLIAHMDAIRHIGRYVEARPALSEEEKKALADMAKRNGRKRRRNRVNLEPTAPGALQPTATIG